MESESPNIQTESADASGDTAGCDVIAVAGADSGCVVGMAATGVVATGVVAAFEAGMAVKANERANVNCSLTSNDFFIQKTLNCYYQHTIQGIDNDKSTSRNGGYGIFRRISRVHSGVAVAIHLLPSRLYCRSCITDNLPDRPE